MADRMIKAFPSLDLRELSRRRAGGDSLLEGSGVTLYASGRSALFHLFKALKGKGRNVVLLPSYHCGVEVEAALRAGWEVSFYRVKRDFHLDLDHLEGAIDPDTKAVMVIHFFGFPQELSPLQKLCRERGLALVEDCAHALYSKSADGEWLGRKGNCAAYSMRKTVFLPNGGAVLLNGELPPAVEKGRKHFELALVKSSARSALEHEAQRTGAAAALSRAVLGLFEGGRKSGAAAADDGEENHRWYYEVPLYHYAHDISPVSSFLMGSPDFRTIIERRAENYHGIVARLSPPLREALLFPELPAGVCPLCVPILSRERDAVVARLKASGVEPFVFGRFLHPLLAEELFPEAVFLSESVIGLPVHQQLTAAELDRLCATVHAVMAP